MNEYSFIQFSATIPTSCELILPIKQVNDLRFFFDLTDLDSIEAATRDGDFIADLTFTSIGAGWLAINEGVPAWLTAGLCFRIAIQKNLYYVYSNLFRYSPYEDSTLVKYLCDEPQFGFNYGLSGTYNQVRLPIRIKEPQFPQEDKVYIDGNGKRILLSSKIDKEYTLETEYFPADWHEKLVVALGHDSVQFDSVKLQKTGSYEIDYTEEDETECNIKLNKATAKMSKNTTIRNTNC